MNQSENSQFLGTENIGKLMMKFSIPCVLSLLVSALYNIVDQIFIGNSELSALGNAATGVVFPIFIIAQAFAWCFGDGCAAYLNICQGKKDTQSAHKAIGTGLIVTLFTSIVLMVFFFPLKTPLLTLFGASENSIEMAVAYFNIILAFFPAYMLSNMMNAVIRADGSPSWSMASMLIGAIVNIILDPVFIFGLHWGMKGAALATVIGQVISFAISFLYFFRTKTFRFTKKSFIPDFKVFAGALKLGTSSFITQMTIVIISLVCNIMLARYGAMSHYGVDIPIAIIGIESKVFTVVINLVVGIVLGCQPIIGYNMGARNYGRVKKLYRAILFCTIAIGAASTLLFELAPQAVVGLFGTPTNLPNPEDYWIFAEKTFRIFLFYYKEMTALAAQESGLDKEFISDINANSPNMLHSLYLSTEVVQQAILAQDKIIRQIADAGSCVIVGRAADYVLRKYDNIVNLFIYAPTEYRVQRVMQVYGDSLEEAKKNIRRSDKARAAYYKNISGQSWGERHHYDLLIDSSVGIEECVSTICQYVGNA